MKRLFYVASALFLFNACSDKDVLVPPAVVPTAAIVADFNERFADATNVNWEMGIDGYFVAKFTQNKNATKAANVASNVEAWYTTGGSCDLIEEDIKDLEALPEAVKNGVDSWITANAGFVVEDIELVQRGEELVYEIEAEKVVGDVETEYELFFNEGGALLSAIIDMEEADNDNVPIPAEITKYISDNYADAIIFEVELDDEDGIEYYSVELVAGGVEYEIDFTQKDKTFAREEAEMLFSQAPEALKTAILLLDETVSDENTEIEKVTILDGESTFEIDSEIEAIDGKTFKADGTEIVIEEEEEE